MRSRKPYRSGWRRSWFAKAWLKLKTSDFRLLTRSRSLPHPTQRADIIFENAGALIDREADGRTYRLIGVGIGDLGEALAADPTDLFSFAT